MVVGLNGIDFLRYRLLVEDEPTSVGYPTRTVLITGLDASVTSAELQSVFVQYGEIVVSASVINFKCVAYYHTFWSIYTWWMAIK